VGEVAVIINNDPPRELLLLDWCGSELEGAVGPY